jgi:hypothetical protein
LGVVDRHIEEPEQCREGGLERPVQGEEFARHLLADLARLIARLDLKVGAEEVDERQERRGLPIGDGAALDDEPAVDAVRVGELPEETRLADTWLADDGHDLAVPCTGPLQGLAELLQLRVAPDEAGEAPGGGRLQPRAHGPGTDDLEDLDRGVQALDRSLPQGLHHNVAFRQIQRLGRDEDRPRHGHLLQARRQVGRLADGRVVHVEVAPDGADDHVAGVRADSDVQRHARGSVYLLGVPFHRFLHPQRGVTRPYGVILVGERGTEERHDPVAHHLIDRALVAVDRLHHSLEHRIEELARLLGVAVGEQLHGALEVGEEDRDLLALALQGGLRGQDLLGEVLGGVRLR